MCQPGCDPLGVVVQEHDYSHVIFTKACNAMRTAAFNNLTNQNLLASEGAIPMIVKGMNQHWDKEHAQVRGPPWCLLQPCRLGLRFLTPTRTNHRM